jgi:hypothetical protein
MPSLPSLPFATVALALVLALASSGCGKPPIEPRYAASVGRPATITVTSRAFTDGSRIPVDHTCDGDDVMPELVLSSPPENTKSLVVYAEDPDVPAGTFTHMIAFNLSPELRKLPSAPDLTAAGETARFGTNDFGATRYRGPCPPKGDNHRYRFRVYALDVMLNLNEGASRSQIDEAMDGHILGDGSLLGHFGH